MKGGDRREMRKKIEKVTIVKHGRAYSIIRQSRKGTDAIIVGNASSVAGAYELFQKDAERYAEQHPDIMLISMITWKGNITEDEAAMIAKLKGE